MRPVVVSINGLEVSVVVIGRTETSLLVTSTPTANIVGMRSTSHCVPLSRG